MISEPHPDVRRMLERMVTRLGYEPVVALTPTPALLRSIDALLVETATQQGAMLVQLARAANPSVAIVCASVTAPPVELSAVGIDFAAVLVKPFTVEQLRSVLARTLGLPVDAGTQRQTVA
jgi:CheY-like chemotaxis protein